MRNRCIKMMVCFLIVLFGIILLLPNKSYAGITTGIGYTIKFYDVYIKVNTDNTFDVTETIDVRYSSFYNSDSFDISLNLLKSLDKNKIDNYIKITNFDCNYEFRTTSSRREYKIYIKKNNNIEQRYILKYKLDYGKDYVKDRDEINYTILENVGKINVDKVSFKINMPKEFDSSKLKFLEGQLNQANIDYTINNNVIIGGTLNKLKSGDSITMQLVLPENYFSDAKINFNYRILLNFVPMICLIISIIIWYKYGKDDKIIETVEFRKKHEWINETELLLNEGDIVNERKYFEKFNLKSIIIIILVIISYISFWLGIGSLRTESLNNSEEGLAMIFLMIFSPFIILSVFRSQEKIIRYGAGLVLLAWIILIINILLIIKGMIESSFHIFYIVFLGNIIIMFIMLLLYYFMFKRTKYANDIIEKSRGYKRFKKVVDENKKY